jgi:hypothetical protein
LGCFRDRGDRRRTAFFGVSSTLGRWNLGGRGHVPGRGHLGSAVATQVVDVC